MGTVFIILGLIILNGLFSMAEIALISARKARLESQAAKGDLKAKAALNLAINPDTFLSTVQIGITLIGLLTGIYSGDKLKQGVVDWLNQFSFMQAYSDGFATVLIVIVLTYFSLVLGELLPKRVGLSNPEKIAKIMATPMRYVSIITHPFIWLLSKSTNVLVKMVGIQSTENQVTEEEIKAIIHEGTEHGAIEEAEQEIIERVFHLGDRNITSLMTHRNDIVWIDITTPLNEIRNIIGERAYSVYPVCDGTIDNLKGVILLKDLFLAGEPKLPAEKFMKTGLFVPENISAYQLLERYREAKSHHAFIVDEYGSVQGLVTLNDVLEAIVGDMVPEDPDDFEIVEREDGSFIIDAQIPFYDFLSFFESEDLIEETENDFDTLAGFIIDKLQKIPATGEKLTWKNFSFEIIDMDIQRIDKVLVTELKDEDAG